MELRTQIKELLTASGLDQEDLAAEFEVTSATISRYLNGQRAMPDGFVEWAIPFLREKCLENASTALTAAQKVAA